ncbi:MAG: T9SS type A sorting domain-containing protein [Sphingobacteriales bacterium]|nr:MAG: T9SS type A sorting domain-containing protein [Sphingobacteriales bacterium]
MKTNRSARRSLAIAASIAFASVMSNVSTAQVYQQDYKLLHQVDPNLKSWIGNDAVYRDDAKGVYYVAQSIRPENSQSVYLGLSICDKDMKPVTSWRYSNNATLTAVRVTEIDEMKANNAIIIVGEYINEGYSQAPFVISIDKTSGAVNWFKLYTNVARITGLKTGDKYAIITGERDLPYPQQTPGDRIYPYTIQAGLIFRVNDDGSVAWAHQVEDDKNASSGYNIQGVYHMMNAVAQLEDDRFVAVGNCNRFVGGNFNDIWENDVALLNVDASGNVYQHYRLGNNLPIDPNGQQSIQFEQALTVTVDPKDGNVVLAGTRYEHPQTYISNQCPVPQAWGLWATKFDLSAGSSVWSTRYEESSGLAYLQGAKIDCDGKGNYGISYNQSGKPIATKLDANGSTMYSRHHYMNFPNVGAKRFNDNTRSFDYNNMIIVGHVEPDVNQYYSSYGFNVEAYDNILQDCQSHDYPVHEIDAPYDVDEVEVMPTTITVVNEPMKEVKIKVLEKTVCSKILVSYKPEPGVNDADVATTVFQDEASHGLVITTNQPSDDRSEYSATLINALGQKVMQTQKFTQTQKMDLTPLSTGVYYIIVTNGTVRSSHTVIVK